jgi:ectoine hydroxylase-related dioxygenase (phytanoyl-CoA dioxygenase family)
MFQINPNIRRLTSNEKEQYSSEGYVTGLPVFADDAVKDLHNWYDELSSKLPDDVDINKTNMWHKASKKFYDLCRTPAILDYVEDLIGPNFVQWGGQFFSKEPKDGSVVPWHQDAQYWPLSPANAVTVWLAVFDTNEENAAMKVVSGSHKLGKFVHKKNDAKNLVLNQEVSFDQIDEKKIVSLNLKAGQISLHNDALLHGSEANNSNRRRCGVTMRFSPTNVKGDLTSWPFFETQLARGIDEFKLNPIAEIPRGEATPLKMFSFSNEFASQW